MIPTTPCLAAAYGKRNGWPFSPATELVRMSDPPPALIRCGMDAEHVFHTPVRLIPITSFQMAGVTASQGLDGADAGVGDHDVEVPELRHAVGHHLGQAVEVPDVELGGQNGGAGLLHQPHRLGQVVVGGERVDDGVQILTAVDSDDVGALLGQPDGVGPSLTACRTGDERYFSLNSAHQGTFPSIMSPVDSCPPPPAARRSARILRALMCSAVRASLQEPAADVKPAGPAEALGDHRAPRNCLPSPVMTQTALLIGGTGPTGPPIALGMAARGYEVTILHSGNHEIPEVADLRHLHGDVFSEEGLRAVLGAETFDVAIASYGRLRSIAEVLVGRVGRLLSIGGAPVYRGFFDPAIHLPPGPAHPDPRGGRAGDRVRRRQELPHRTHRGAAVRLAPERHALPLPLRLRPPSIGAARMVRGQADPGSPALLHSARRRAQHHPLRLHREPGPRPLVGRRPSRGVDGRDLQLRRRREAHHPPGGRNHHRRARSRLGAPVSAGPPRHSRPAP